MALPGEAGVVEEQGGVAFGRQGPQDLDALLVQVVFVPEHGREQSLEGLLRGARDDLGDGIAVLVRVFGEHPGEVAFQGAGGLAPLEVDVEGGQELGQFRQRLRRSVREADGVLHTPLDPSLA